MNQQKGLWSAVALTTSIGLSLAAALAVGVGLGLFLDRSFGTRPWFAVGGCVIGLAAGISGAYRMVVREMSKS
jgi:F0F1-type ATP synthase assembly protein I